MVFHDGAKGCSRSSYTYYTYYGYTYHGYTYYGHTYQELIDCFSMREAAAAQLALLREQPEVYSHSHSSHSTYSSVALPREQPEVLGPVMGHQP